LPVVGFGRHMGQEEGKVTEREGKEGEGKGEEGGK